MAMSNEILGKIQEDISEIRQILARQEESLKLHIYRTELAEENINLLRKQVEPVKKHVDFINNLGKIVLVAAALATALKHFGVI